MEWRKSRLQDTIRSRVILCATLYQPLSINTNKGRAAWGSACSRQCAPEGQKSLKEVRRDSIPEILSSCASDNDTTPHDARASIHPLTTASNLTTIDD
jgi:hypothetical protein